MRLLNKKLLSILFILFVASCQNEADQIPDTEIQVETISVVNDAKLSGILRKGLGLPGLEIQSTGNLSSEDDSGSRLDMSKAVRAYNPESGVTQYSLLVENDLFKNPFAFQNFIITEKEEDVSAHVIQYEPDLEWAVSNIAQEEFRMDDFTGYATLFTLDGEPVIQSYLKKGKVKKGGPSGISDDCIECELSVYESKVTGNVLLKADCGDFDFFIGDVGANGCGDTESTDGGGSGSLSGEGFLGGDPSGGYVGFDETSGGGGGGSVAGSVGDFSEDPIGFLNDGISFDDDDISLEERLEFLIEQEEDANIKRKMQLEYLKTRGEREFAEFMESMFWPGNVLTDLEKSEFHKLITKVYLRNKAEYVLAIFSVENVASILSLGLYSPNLRVVTRSNYFKGLARYANGALGKSFKSFDAFKRAHPAKKGNQWHHVVEQRNTAKFGADQIHNTKNLFEIPAELHQKISNFYSSGRNFADGQVVRQWLNSKSFRFQYEFGLDIMRRVLNGLPLPG